MIWDLPTRLFHWGFVVAISGAFFSGQNGWVDAHELFGLAAGGLVVFRLIWGFVGHETARFRHFLKPPVVILVYAVNVVRRRRHGETAGHNPLGGVAVLALLAVMGSMAVTGLWTGDDILYEAPLTAAGVGPRLAVPMAVWHERLHLLVPLLVIVHVLAIIAHRLWLGEKLVSRMITGGTAATQPSPRRSFFGLVLLAACVGGSLSLSLLTPTYG